MSSMHLMGNESGLMMDHMLHVDNRILYDYVNEGAVKERKTLQCSSRTDRFHYRFQYGAYTAQIRSINIVNYQLSQLTWTDTLVYYLGDHQITRIPLKLLTLLPCNRDVVAEQGSVLAVPEFISPIIPMLLLLYDTKFQINIHDAADSVSVSLDYDIWDRGYRPSQGLSVQSFNHTILYLDVIQQDLLADTVLPTVSIGCFVYTESSLRNFKILLHSQNAIIYDKFMLSKFKIAEKLYYIPYNPRLPYQRLKNIQTDTFIGAIDFSRLHIINICAEQDDETSKCVFINIYGGCIQYTAGLGGFTYSW